uniref:Putative ribonuclease H-like domain-containing protein n=1 Tax=Tanacetum cinerariifolium TaxID=118510 RepID=A0A6L2LBN3_TANCI|nr:putative ribonuclease H-like domain-containing protein [Tanacetum cinerariifolium]
MTDFSLWEVIKNGNKVLTKPVGSSEQTYKPTTTEEKQDKRNEIKARGTLLMALPNKDQLKFHSYQDAKILMEAIEKRYGGNKESKKVQRTLLKQQYENFAASNTTASGVSTAHTQGNTVTSTSVDNLSDAMIRAFLASQPNTPQLAKEDVEQPDPDDLEEMDLHWKMAMLTIRARRAPRNQDNRDKEYRRTTFLVETPTENALIAQDVIGGDIMKLPPLTRSYMPLKRDLRLIDEHFESEYVDVFIVSSSADKTIKTVDITHKGVLSTEEPKSVMKNNFGPPIIEDWHSDDDNEDELSPTVKGNPQQKEYKEKRVIDSGCSRHMTGNKCYLTDFKAFDGGFVSFGDGKGRISSKGEIKIGKLDFDDVHFCKELKYNLFSMSQMCDKKNNVLFTDIECRVLSSNFKLLNESQVLLRVLRKDNIYSVELKSVVPTRGLTCLFAKATLDESNLWHRGLGHINFKTMNKLVKGNLVRGLPSKIFQNDNSCVAFKKGKQYKASYKAKLVNIISKPLHMLHMDLFCPTNVTSLMKKSYCLVITDDFSRFSWVFFLATKGETNEILKTFITGIENQPDCKVKVIRSDNGTEFKNSVITQFYDDKGIKREYSVARTPQQNKVVKRRNRTLIEAARTIPDWLFDIDSLTISMNYVPVVTGNQTNGIGGAKEKLVAGQDEKKIELEQEYILIPICITGLLLSQDAKYSAEDAGKKAPEVDADSLSTITVLMILIPVSLPISTTGPSFVNAASQIPLNVAGPSASTNAFEEHSFERFSPLKNAFSLPHVPMVTPIDDTGIFRNAYDDDVLEKEVDMNNVDSSYAILKATKFLKDHPQEQVIESLETPVQTRHMSKTHEEFGLLSLVHKLRRTNHKDFQNCLFACFLSQMEPKKPVQALQDPSWLEAMQEELLQFKLLKVWTLVDLPKDKKKELSTKCEKLMHDKLQMSSMGELSFFLGLKVKQKSDGIFISQDKYVAEILKKFDFVTMKTASTSMKSNKPLIKDEEAEGVDVHLYRSMIGSLMYLTVSRPKITFDVCACLRFMKAKDGRCFVDTSEITTSNTLLSTAGLKTAWQRVNTLGSGEDSLKLQELMVFCTNYPNRLLVVKMKNRQSDMETMIEEIDQDDEIALDADTQGRKNNDEMFGVDDLTGEKVVLDTTTGEHEEQIIEDVSTTEPVTTACEVVTTVIDKVSAASTIDVTEDEITMAQALAALKSTRPKVVVQEQEVSTIIPAAATTVTTVVPTLRAKGIIFHEQKQSHISTVSSSKDKGKAKMIEPKIPIKKKDQMRMDEEYARQLEAKEQEASRLSRAQQDEEANISWENTHKP